MSATKTSPRVDTDPQSGKRSRLARKLTPYAFLSPTILLLTMLMLIPIGMVITYSFVARAVTNPDFTFVGFDNYIKVLSDEHFYGAIWHTLIFSVGSVIAHFVLGIAFALLLNSRYLGKRFKTVMRALFILPWLFTIAVVAVLWRMILNPNGVVNALLSEIGVTSGTIEWLADPALALPVLTFVNIWCGYPFFMVSLLAGLQGVPKDLYEAAVMDRLGPIGAFRYVTLPHLKPIIISLGLLDFIWTSQQFALVWLLTGGGPVRATEVAPTYIYKLAFSEYQFAQASAAAVIVLLLSMILAFFYVRHQRAER